MFDYRGFATRRLSAIGTKYLPFADVASDDVPLSQLLRLSLFQVTVGMALVLLGAQSCDPPPTSIPPSSAPS